MLAHFGHHLVGTLLTPLLPFIRNDFALDYTQAGGLVSAYTIAYGIGQLPGGWLADRIGPRLVLTAGIAGVAAAGIMVGLSTTYVMLVLFLILLGLMGGGYHPASAPLVSAAVKPQNRGKALGLHQIGGTGSFFLTPLIAAGIAGALGWRGTFLAVSIPTIVFGIIFYVLLGRFEYTKKTKPGTPGSPSEAPHAPGRLRPLVAMVTLGIGTMVLIYSAISFIPLFIVDHFGTSEATAAAMLALVYSGGLWAGPLGGYLSDRIGKVPVMLAVGLIGGPVVYLMNLAPFGWIFSVILILIGMAQHLGMPVVEAYVISHSSERRRSTVLGIYYSARQGGPGIIAPLIGYLIDHYGFHTSFSIVGATVVVVTLVCTALLWGSKD
ncbi:MFS transporter [Chloroflexota bacterium]